MVVMQFSSIEEVVKHYQMHSLQNKFLMSVVLDENPWFAGSMEREKAEQFLMEVSHFQFW